MSEQRKFVPLPDAQSPRVRFDVPFPSWLDTERIGINLQAIHRLMRLGGIRHLRVVGITGEETSGFIPTIVGFNRQGEGYAGAAGIHRVVNTFDTQSQLMNNPPLTLAGRWVDATIQMNMDEIKQRIQKKETVNVRDVSEWSSHLNKALKEGIMHIGVHFLLTGTPAMQLGIIGISESLNDFTTLHNDHGLHPIHLLSTIATLNVVQSVFDMFTYYGFKQTILREVYDFEEGYRFSLIYGPQVDRALILTALAKTQTLAKALPQRRGS